ncbi:MAG TPA: Uma2 family endonuclease [Pyrinomonadaceae bacterium]|nr:Uma2 family endonuclease [Pyrinomonadaceae bacterium]
MSSTTTKLVTADELLMMPKDGFHYELVRGELKRMSPTGRKHGSVTMALASPLYQFVRLNKLGEVYAAETGFKLESNPDTVRAPDIAFICAERIQSAGRAEGYGEGAPDLAVEVLSPGNTKREMTEKVEDYFAAGARLVWIVNPKLKTVTVYRSPTDIVTLTEQDTLDGGEVVPGFQIPVAGIFAI